MFRIVVLGSGGSIPSPDRCTSSIGLRCGGKVYLLDACEGVQRQMMRFGLSYFKVEGIFITHLHPDHYLGIPGLVYTLQLNEYNGKLVIAGPRGTAEAVSGMLNGKVPPFVELREFVGEGEVFRAKEFRVRVFRAEHGTNAYGFAVEGNDKRKFDERKARGMGIEGKMFSEIEKRGAVEINGKSVALDDVSHVEPGVKIVYTGDTTLSDNVIGNSKGADVLFHDATFIEENREDADEKQHSTAGDAAHAAERAGCKRLVLMHISTRYKTGDGHLEEAARTFNNSAVAEDGLEINI